MKDTAGEIPERGRSARRPQKKYPERSPCVRGNVAVLDGDTMRELDRFHVGMVHGGPKFDRAYRTVVESILPGG